MDSLKKQNNVINNYINTLVSEQINPIIAEHSALCIIEEIIFNNNIVIKLILIGPCYSCNSLILTQTAISNMILEELMLEFSIPQSEINIIYV